MEKLIEIIIAIIGSGAFFTFLQFLINRKDSQKDKIDGIDSKLNKIEKNLVKAEKDNLRTQLMLMISTYPDEETEILQLAQHYFKDLKGNWVCTAIFQRYLKDRNIERPDWFD